MKISIIIPTFNREEDLCKTIKLLWGQTYENYEIIIIDQSFSHSIKTEQFLIDAEKNKKIVLHKEGIPNAARARNIGVTIASGDILLFLDDDVLLEVDFLENHLNMYENPHCHAVQGYVFDEEGKKLYSENIELKLSFSETVKFVNLPGGNFSVLRRVFEALGGFDERFVYASTHEDTDFSLRFYRAGFHALISPRASLIHLLSLGGGRDKKIRDMVPRKQRLIAQFYFYLKNTSGFTMMGHFLSLIKLYVFTWYKCKHPIIFTKSFFSFFKSLFLAIKLKNTKNFNPETYC